MTTRVRLAALIAITACENGNKVADDDRPPSSVPTAVSCTDAPQLRQRALDDRRRSDETKSDQEQISIGSRAVFFAALAIIADLKCKVTLADADEALRPAFDAARSAEDASSFYEVAQKWDEAALVAAQVISLLVQQVPAPPQ